MAVKKELKEIPVDPGYDFNKVDDAILALLHLTMWEEKVLDDFRIFRAWKGHDWDALSRLHEKGMIHDPRGKARSLGLTKEGSEKSQQLFRRLFGNAA